MACFAWRHGSGGTIAGAVGDRVGGFAEGYMKKNNDCGCGK